MIHRRDPHPFMAKPVGRPRGPLMASVTLRLPVELLQRVESVIENQQTTRTAFIQSCIELHLSTYAALGDDPQDGHNDPNDAFVDAELDAQEQAMREADAEYDASAMARVQAEAHAHAARVTASIEDEPIVAADDIDPDVYALALALTRLLQR